MKNLKAIKASKSKAEAEVEEEEAVNQKPEL